MRVKLLALFLSIAAIAVSSPVAANVIYLDFENIVPHDGSSALIQGYYNGGLSEAGTSGVNYGVEFGANAYVFCLTTADFTCTITSKGGLGIPTSVNTALTFRFGDHAPINVAAGFDTAVSFAYVHAFNGGQPTVTIYSGLNGTGNVLASADLPPTPFGACSNGTAACPFENFSLSFSGVAKSVLLNGDAFDDLTFGSATVGGEVTHAMPEASTWAMMILGLGFTGAGMRVRRRSNVTTNRLVHI